MAKHKSSSAQLRDFRAHLVKARKARGLTQAQLARRCKLNRVDITFFERGRRLPSLGQLLLIAEALDVSVQRFLTGTDRPRTEPKALAIELRSLGLVDLWVDGPQVPGAFRRPEEVVACAVAGEVPEARIVEGLAAVLAWNRWSPVLLRAYGRVTRPRTLYRLAWLAEVALALDRGEGFPGGCPGRADLEAFVSLVKPPPAKHADSLGRPAHEPLSSPVWKRWRIDYTASLATFRERAEALLALRRGGNLPSEEGV